MARRTNTAGRKARPTAKPKAQQRKPKAQPKSEAPARRGRKPVEVKIGKRDLTRLCKQNRRADGTIIISRVANELDIGWSKCANLLVERGIIKEA